MKRLLLIPLILLSVLLAGSNLHAASAAFNGSGQNPVAGGCVSCDPDARLFDDSNNADDSFALGTFYRAKKVITTGTNCITGIFFNAGDAAESVTFTVELWDDDGEPTEVKAGFSKTCGSGDLPTGAADGELIFDSIQTLPAGTYWIVVKGSAAGILLGRDTTSGTGDSMYDEDGVGTWTASSSDFELGLLGCTP